MVLLPRRSNSPVCSTRSSLAWPSIERFADFVEEQRAASAARNVPAALWSRPCTRGFGAEQLGLLRSSATRRRDLDERTPRTVEFAWMIAASTSLPEPFGPGDEYRHVGGGYVRGLRDHARIASLSNTSPHRSNFSRQRGARLGRRRAARSSRPTIAASSIRLRIVSAVAHRPRLRDIVRGAGLDEIDRVSRWGPGR